jgi:nifR3 family TIM-barrel protein
LVKIGNTNLPDRFLALAPMEDMTDPSFRFICKMYGADILYTEFISSDGLIRSGAKSLQKLQITDHERPIGIQIYGHLTDSMVEAARMVEASRPDLIDLNFGCPVKKISRRGAGAGMLKNIPLMTEITRAVVKAVNLPVTVKTRLGWDESSKVIVDVALQLQDAGIAALTIHGRTGTQQYRGTADWTLIGEVKNHLAIHIPVIGNGDVDTPEKALNMFDTYRVDGVMIGRAAIGMPWIFRDIRHYLQTGELLPQPGINERVDLAKLHLEKSLAWKGERKGVLEMRRHFINYFKGLSDFRETRQKLVTTSDIEEINDLLESIRKRYAINDA